MSESKKIILVILIAFVAGILGELAVRFYFFKDLYAVPYGNEVNLGAPQFSKNNVVINDPKKVIVNQDSKVDETVAAIDDSLFGIFKKQSSSTPYYNLDQATVYGLALTNDGWLMLNTPIVFNAKDLAANYVAIGKNKKVYALDQLIDDHKDNLLFVHLKDVNNLSIRNLDNFNNLVPGQTILTTNWAGDTLLSSVVNIKNLNSEIRNSDKLSLSIITDVNLSDNFKNGLVFNLTGDLVGLINENKTIRAVVNYRALILNILKTRSLETPVLGLNYRNLTGTVQNVPGRYGEILKQNGALITPDEKGVAIIKNSPADIAGLKINDLILAVDGVNLDENNDLATIIQNNTIGSTITLKYLRGADINQVDLKLVSKK